MSLATTHENYSHHWWTPEPWMDWVRASVGAEPHDPCPREWDGTNGLQIPWEDGWYCNHPGSRGSTQEWWTKAWNEHLRGCRGIWCAFSVEQLRHMRPFPYSYRDECWLVMPRERIGFVWGGPDLYRVDKRTKLYTLEEVQSVCPTKGSGRITLARKHGDPATSPGNWTVFLCLGLVPHESTPCEVEFLRL